MDANEKVVTQTGFFTMDVIRQVCAAHTVEVAKQIALEAIENYEHNAQKENVRKAQKMVERAKTVKDLGISLANFMLAHPSENLKSIR